jgi:glycosyltransferase involved in cell wall biosynthesis
MISVLILTKNEQNDLPGCIESVAWSDDIHVYDSYSSDRTLDLAAEAGARITQRRFDNWSQHQNWGLKNIPFKYSWVLYVDADERVSPNLKTNLQNAVRDPGTNVAFRVRRRDFFENTWLKHSQATHLYPRLFRPEKMRYERLVNPVSIIDGPVGQVEGYLDHYPFSKGVTHWLDRHNSYSSLEAQQIIANRSRGRGFSLQKFVTARDFSERRYQQKELFYLLPARPVIKFLLLYLAKRGFLDGRAGLTYSVLQSLYEYMIILKVREMTHALAGLQTADQLANQVLESPSRLASGGPE